jgi:uncharacterized repeat protein (TIGR03803 family)
MRSYDYKNKMKILIKIYGWKKALVIISVIGLLYSGVVRAETVSVLSDFPAPEGQAPRAAMLQATDGFFYGTTSMGGLTGDGTIFEFDAVMGKLTTVYTFKGADGSNPEMKLIQASDGNLYGTTRMGGASGKGTIFRFDPRTSAFTSLRSFTGANGESPNELMQASDGLFYGTTVLGGVSNMGTVFKMDATGNITTLRSFTGTNGRAPRGGLVQRSDGFFYGITGQGGASNIGTIFKINSTGTLTTLHSFNGTQGQSPYGTLAVGSDGFYGTASSGGASFKGVIFKFTFAGVFTHLSSFNGSNGANPTSGLVLGTDGNLYGTTMFGGASNFGVIYKVTPTGTISVLHAFAAGEGSQAISGLALSSSGLFYGVTPAGGPPGAKGTLFSISAAGSFANLYSFKGSPAAPLAGLIQASDGKLYGTTDLGGAFGAGAVYKADLSGKLEILHAFSGLSDGGRPRARVVQGVDGNFYGTTREGGSGTQTGSIFKVTPAGICSVLHAFSTDANGCIPLGELVQGVDGNFYGTTSMGPDNKGTLFKITPSGTFTKLHTFIGANGATPQAGLTRGIDGNFYGATSGGGATLSGTIYKITPAGAFTQLYSFNGSDGKYPKCRLIEGTDGNFYGTTELGGASDFGTLFKFNPSTKILTTLYSFNGSNGKIPIPGLTLAAGSLYGVCTYGGTGGAPLGHGTVFKFDLTAGTLTKLHDFQGSNGRNPQGALLLAGDGNLYGTTWGGGAADNGVLFRVSLGGSDTTPPTVPTGLTASTVSSSQIDLSWTASSDTVGVTGYKIYRGGALIGTVSGTTYSDTGLSASTAYSYKVAAFDAVGNSSAQSSAVSATTLAGSDTTPPTVPTGLTASAISSSQIDLSWTASTDTLGVSGYKIYRGGTQIGTSTTTTYSDSGLAASTTYNYKVAAYDAAGNTSAKSSAASATTLAGSGGDGDGDGLPDSWEVAHFGSSSDPRAQPDLDPDADGFTNLSEYMAGTTPVSSSSRLAIVDETFPSSTSFKIDWQSVVGKTYEVQSSIDMITWTTVTSVTAASTTTTWTNTELSGIGKKFYRVRIP